ALTEFYTLSLHDALPIWMVADSSCSVRIGRCWLEGFASVVTLIGKDYLAMTFGLFNCSNDHGLLVPTLCMGTRFSVGLRSFRLRSEEHTSELQSRENLVC